MIELVDDPETALWLESFNPILDGFDWDAGNEGKNAKHGITDGEIETLFHTREYAFFGKIVGRDHSEWRGLIVGALNEDVFVALVFTRREDRIRPISCRVARTNERRMYAERKAQA